MNNFSRKALNAYQQESLDVTVSMASPHRLIVMLYEGAIKAIGLAKIHIQNGAVPEKGAAISKAIAIIEDGLRLSLDKGKGGELAENLDALYEYMTMQLLEANLYNRIENLDAVAKLLSDLKEAWDSIDVAAMSATDSQHQPLVRGHV